MSFESDGQFFTSAVIFIYAFLWGTIFFIVNLFCDKTLKNKAYIIKIPAFIIIFSAFAVFYFALSVSLDFPDFRFYMPLLCAAGLFVSYKTQSVIVAKSVGILYNIKIKIKNRRKNGKIRKKAG